MKNKQHDFTFFNEEWNTSNETDYNDDWTDSRPKQKQSRAVEDW